jgi:hypothetical protein
MPKQTVEIESRVLKPFRRIAAVLGVPLNEVIQRALDDRASAIKLESLDNVIQLYFADCIFRSRKRAEGVARRIEDFAVECSLAGRADSGDSVGERRPIDRRSLDGQNRLFGPTRRKMAFPLGLRRRIRGLEGLANRICFVGESDSFLPRDQ